MKLIRTFTYAAASAGMALFASVLCSAQTHDTSAKNLNATFSSAQTPANYVPPKTKWGDPDLQGIWTSDDLHDVPMQRPAKYGNRRFLTEQEWAAREHDVKDLLGSENDGVRRKVGYFGHAAPGVESAAVPQNWVEFARQASHLTSLVADPPNGQIPPLTAEAAKKADEVRAMRRRRPDSWLNISTYDRCITRGVAGSMLPVIYGNGTQIIQVPGEVVIRYEMVHDTRIIPLDGRPHAGNNYRTYMGDAVGHWEGNTLVVETTNFKAGNLGIAANGNDMPPYSADLKLVERFTRTGPGTIDYHMRVDDPKTYTAPWTIEFPITHVDGYQIFEYACHEGNYGLRNILSAARAEDKADAEKARAKTNSSN